MIDFKRIYETLQFIPDINGMDEVDIAKGRNKLPMSFKEMTDYIKRAWRRNTK